MWLLDTRRAGFIYIDYANSQGPAEKCASGRL